MKYLLSNNTSSSFCCLLVLLIPVAVTAVGLTPPHSSRGFLSYNWHNQYPINLLDFDDDDFSTMSDSTSHSSASTSGIHDPLLLTLAGTTARGGAAGSTNKAKPSSSSSLTETTKEYWSNLFTKAANAITKPFRESAILSGKKPSFLLSKEEKRQTELIDQLKNTPILHVKIASSNNSTVVPPQVVQIAAKRAGLLGKPLQTQAVQQVAQSLKSWYDRQGYILHSMTGATLQVDTQTAELAVQEPVSSSPPVELIYCREMVINSEDDSLLTIRQYRDQLAAAAATDTAMTAEESVKGRFGRRRRPKFDRSKVNTTFIPTEKGGRTDPKRMADVLGLAAGKPFVWHPYKWKVVSKRLFKRAIRATPQRMDDGTVQLQLVVQEAPARHLEYGLSKSLYTDSWEGEVDFQHQNLLGGGEALGITVRRGTHDAEPSVRLELENDHFGLLPRGYTVQLFSDYIGESLEVNGEDGGSDGVGITGRTVDGAIVDYDHDELLDRKGSSISIRSPFRATAPWIKTTTACLERTSTKGGRHESVGSTTLNLGPVSRTLPLDARTSVFGKVMTGTRLGEMASKDKWSLLPFCSVQATTRQTFPLTNGERPLVLALSHSATASTSHLPRHEANAHGVACKVRGYHGGGSHKTSERVANSLIGTTELRIPVLHDASVVVFGDWCFSQAPSTKSMKRRSSVGIGLRKNVQGFPIKYDISYTKDHKIGAYFGLGPDFQV